MWRWRLGLLSAIGMLLAHAQVQAQAAAPVPVPAAVQAAAPTTLTVVSDDNYPPYMRRRADGTVEGYLVDLWALWQQKTGVQVKLQAMAWADARQRMAAGQADVIDTIFHTEERAAQLDFTPPYATLPAAIFVDHHIGGITGPESLRGFLVAAKAGDACIDHLKKIGVHNIHELPSYERIVEAAVNDVAPIFCMDEPPANYLLHRSGADRHFNKAFVLYSGQLHRAVKKGDAATLALLQRGFEAISPAEMRALREKWMGTPMDAQALSRWLLAGLTIALLSAVLALVWAITMRRAVQRRTAELREQGQRLRTLLDSLPDLVWLKDMDGRYVTCNRRFETLLGVPESAIVGRSDAELLDRATAAMFAESDQRVLTLNHECSNQKWLSFKHLDYRGLFETIKTPMRNAEGGIVGVLGIGRDVTQHRAAQDRLQRLNQLYRVLIAVAECMAGTRDRLALYAAVCAILIDDGGLRMAWIGEADGPQQRILPRAQAGLGTDCLQHAPISLAAPAEGPQRRCPTATAFSEGRTVSANDLADDGSVQLWQRTASCRQFRALAAFPVRVRTAVRAVLSVYSETVNFFDAEELQLLERLAGQLGLALEAAESEAARCHAEAELRASEARFAQMFLTSPVGMTLAHQGDGRIVDVNEAWLKLFQRERAEVIGCSDRELDVWALPAQRQQALDRLQTADQTDSIDAAMRRRDGARLDIAFNAARVDLGGQRYALASYADVSLRRQVERRLKDQAEQLERQFIQRTAEFNSLFQALPDVYFRVAQDGTILDYRAGRQADLYSPPELFLGRRMQQVMPPQVGSELAAVLDRARAAGAPTEMNYTLLQPEGDSSFEARVIPLNDDFVVVVRNISERMAFERAREKALAEATDLSRLRSEFLANMSHEIRTPLNGIMGLAQIGWAQSADATTRDTFNRLLDSSKFLLAIINDILDFSKIDADLLVVESLPVNLHELMTGAIDGVRESAAAKGLALTVTMAPGLPTHCLGDPLRMRQILLNLLTNAIKFTERGYVAVTFAAQGDTLLLRVSDSGIGIQAAQLPQLFEPFRQADASTTRRYGGSGLGLSISRRLAQLMGGDVLAQSTWGRGSEFELRMPLQAVEAPRGDADRPERWTAGRGRLQGLHILVAEDNAVNQIVLESALLLEGATVELVEDGQQAVQRVADEKAPALDLVLLDLQMPVMGGLEAARLITERRPDLPLIGQTAEAGPQERERCFEAGMVAHVAKPVDLEVLVTAVLKGTARQRSTAVAAA